jgi:tubulin monoglycylase TTLL15
MSYFFYFQAFKLPADANAFKEYSAKHPDKLFVQKHHQHRHIHIKSVDEIDFNDGKSFLQEFIDKPYLVDGHKFDIGVYTIITSVDPLRVHIYKGDILFRFCPVQYHPFDQKNVDKYIVGDDYLPIWQVDSLRYYYNELGFGMKDTFDAYVRSNGEDPSVIWTQVEDAIRSLILKKESLLVSALQRYAFKWNFFEMMRFDLIVTEDLKVYLMEANMSPNLSSAHFKPNRVLYEQVIYHLMKLTSVASDLDRESFNRRDRETEIMVSNNKNIAVKANICASEQCKTSCGHEKCRMCQPCLSQTDSINLHKSYREHINRGDTKRIFPVPKKDKQYENFEELSRNNQFMTEWFDEKCKVDESFCG